MLNLAVAFFFSTNFSLANNIFESSGTNMATEIHRGDGLFLIPEKDDQILDPEHPFEFERGHIEIALNESTTCT